MPEISKKAVWESCYHLLQQKVEHAESAMLDQQKMANEYGPPKDRYDSFRAQLLRKKDLFAEQFQQAKDELDILLKINPDESSTKVEFGALVHTNGPILYIAVGLGKLTVEGNDVFVISPKVPLFNAIRDLKENDIYEFNKRSFTILKID